MLKICLIRQIVLVVEVFYTLFDGTSIVSLVHLNVMY